MSDTPQHNFGFERNAPQNDIEGAVQTYLHVAHNAVGYADQALTPIVDAERRRQQAQPRQQPQPSVLKLVQEAPVTAEENLFTETDPDALAEQQRQVVDRIHAEVEAERRNEELRDAA